MKKKLLFITLMVAMLICLFAISASASASDYFGEVEIIDLNGDGASDIAISDMLSVIKDGSDGTQASKDARLKISCDCSAGGHTFPAYYVTLKSTGNRFYCYTYSKLNELLPEYCGGSGTKNGTNIIAYELPNGYKNIYSGFFYENISGSTKMAATNLKYFSVAECSTMTSFEGTSAGRNWLADSSIVEFNVGKYVTNIPVMLCYNCQSLSTFTILAESQITIIGGSAFYNCISLSSVIIPSTVTNIESNAFQKCTSLKEINLENVQTLGSRAFGNCDLRNIDLSSVTSFGDATFESNKNLTTVSLENNTTLTAFANYTFGVCSSLQSITIPDSVTAIGSQVFTSCTALTRVNISENSNLTSIGSQAFNNCSNLEALYLPSGITSIGATGSGTSPFNNCSKLYFVNTPNEAKPEVYFFPANLSSVIGEAFKSCTSLNSVLVFPTGVTAIENGWAFCNAGSYTLVFLGDITAINKDGSWTKQNAIYYCHPNDVDDTCYTTKSAGNNAKNTYYCYAEGNMAHLQNPKAPTSQGATCLEGAMTFKTCFCNTKFDIANDESNPALGHIYNLDSVTAMVYADYTKDAVITCGCDREGCEGVNAETVMGSHLFTYNGYSRNSKGDMCVGYIVNAEYLECYKALKQEGFSFGLVGTVIDFDDMGDILQGEDNPLAPDYEGKIMSLDLTEKTGYSAYDMRITGFGDAHKDLFLAMNLYVIDGEKTSYIWDGAEGGTNTVVNYKQYSAISE